MFLKRALTEQLVKYCFMIENYHYSTLVNFK